VLLWGSKRRIGEFVWESNREKKERWRKPNNGGMKESNTK
jgi:hypothetical protein